MSTINTTNLKNPSSGSNNIVLNADGTSTLTPSNIIKSGTAVASTSGTSIDFTGLPSWVKRVTVMFAGVSTSGTSNPQVQLGDTGGIETSNYLGTAEANGFSVNHSSGWTFDQSHAAASIQHGSLLISLIGSNTWAMQGMVSRSDTNIICRTSGSKALSDTLTQLRITTVNGTDTFDAGTVNILYEG